MCPTPCTDAQYTQILREELVPAMGCTEPIALAYAAALVRKTLGCTPEKVLVEASGSIIKNVKSVIVPNTGHLKGIAAAVCAGIIAGNADAQLQVLAAVPPEAVGDISAYLEKDPVRVDFLDSPLAFDLRITAHAGEDSACVRIANAHTNVVLLEKNGDRLIDTPVYGESEEGFTDRSGMSVQGIWDYVQRVNIDDISGILTRQERCNMAIAEAGIAGDWGANIGKVMLAAYGNDVRTRAKALAAAGSDARMNGCEMPVIINSGSGNQGITCCVPVVTYAREMQASRETTLRALALSNLIAIHIKTGIGRLSAFCGAVSAGAAAGAGIAYLHGATFQDVCHTVVNALGIVSGMICDGAKASCAAKIASSVEAGVLGWEMYRQGQQFYSGDGIIAKGIEQNIRNIGRLGKDGMRETNLEILKMMLDIG
ncbi:MAG: serine dehydratase subunit alpha family protein [Clostridiales bacterium]|nr:serine dehydratase subunit alpha family protein [Clostridiales bacterium]